MTRSEGLQLVALLLILKLNDTSSRISPLLVDSNPVYDIHGKTYYETAHELHPTPIVR
jgi:hypothetical protein